MPAPRFLSAVPLTLLLCTVSAAQHTTQYFSVPGPDAPELAPRGPFSVGVRTIETIHPGQVDILHIDKQTGKAPLYDRPLTLEIWYPAIVPPGQSEQTTYESPMPGRRELPPEIPKTFQIAGKALRDAAPVKGRQFPLVVVSHGYPGSRTFMTYITENLASKGYVVAAIDHTDSVFGAIRGFESTLLNRSADQRFTIDEIQRRSAEAGDFLNGIVDTSKVAVIGYSMGGYGALATAGAPYSRAGLGAKLVPGTYFADAIAAHTPPPPNVKAVVAIAPWGAQPTVDSWDQDGFAGIRIPTLFIVGDRDDVSIFDQGVKRAFTGAVHSERCMLVYENARHNVGANPPPPGVPLDFTGLESFDEPVWRKDRITAINQHFITAFLDLYLKGDESRRAFLHVSPAKSDDGQWPLPRDQSVGAQFSKGDVSHGQTEWKGFQRRWSVGLEMYCAPPQ